MRKAPSTREQFPRWRQRTLDLPFEPVTMGEAVAWARQRWPAREGRRIVTVNATMLVSSRAQGRIADYIHQADLRVCDGVPLVWLSHLYGRPVPERVAGIDLLRELLAAAAGERRSVFLLGARPGVAEAAAGAFQRSHPGLRVAGLCHGYFSHDDQPRIVQRIEQASVDLLVLAMGAEREADFMCSLGRPLRCGVVIGVGGTLDVAAGRLRRAPALLRRLGMEWVFRAIQEPARLAPRYIRTALSVAGSLVRDIVTGSCRQ